MNATPFNFLGLEPKYSKYDRARLARVRVRVPHPRYCEGGGRMRSLSHPNGDRSFIGPKQQ